MSFDMCYHFLKTILHTYRRLFYLTRNISFAILSIVKNMRLNFMYTISSKEKVYLKTQSTEATTHTNFGSIGQTVSYFMFWETNNAQNFLNASKTKKSAAILFSCFQITPTLWQLISYNVSYYCGMKKCNIYSLWPTLLLKSERPFLQSLSPVVN